MSKEDQSERPNNWEEHYQQKLARARVELDTKSPDYWGAKVRERTTSMSVGKKETSQEDRDNYGHVGIESQKFGIPSIDNGYMGLVSFRGEGESSDE